MTGVVLPSTVEELNYREFSQPLFFKPESSGKGFENIATASYKREFSLPDGVEWNVEDYESYLNFQDNIGNNFKAVQSPGDSIVPGEAELRQRSESFSSMTSTMDDKSLVYHNMGVKTFSTVCMDSGSTCISSEHSYVTTSPAVFKEEEETYQNLSTYFNQGSEMHPTDSLSSISPVNSPPTNDNSNLEYSVLNNFSMIGNCSQDGFSEISVGSKRLSDTSDDDLFLVSSAKRRCDSPNEIRKKNNISSKNCRKTRKEKQKEMEVRVAELEKEREQLNASIEMLEKMIKAHHVHLCTILNSRQSVV